MQTAELVQGRSFGIRLDDGEDFFAALGSLCKHSGMRQGYISMLLGGFSEAEIVGTCERVLDPRIPIWAATHLTNIDLVGCGTIAYDSTTDRILPHIHVSVGQKARGALACTSHLLSGTVQFLVEMLVVEVLAPDMRRPLNAELYDVPTLTFESTNGLQAH